MRLSYSKLSTFLSCPQKFHLKYNLNIPEIQTEEMHLGGLLHETIHCRLKNAPINPAVDDFIVRMADKVIEYLRSKLVIVGSEVFFEIPFEDNVFQGFIDIIAKDTSNRLYVLDFKIGSGNLLQTKIYARMLEKAKGKLVDFIGLLKININGDPIVSEDVRPFDDRESVDVFLQKAIDSIKSEQTFAPKPGVQCLSCTYVEMCPLKEFVLQKKLTALSIEEKLDLLNYIEAFENSLKQQIKEALKTTERIETESMLAYMEESTYKKMSVKQLSDDVLSQLFERYGFNAFEPKKEILEEEFPELFRTVTQKRLKIVCKEEG